MMTKKNRTYWTPYRILETGAQWLFPLGGRDLGKSYGVKNYEVEAAYKHNTEIVYLRRWNKDIKQMSVESYFGDCQVAKITKGEYEGVLAYQGVLYFYKLDEETQKPIRGRRLGRYCSLNESARYKSQVFGDISAIIYEEVFPEDNLYLDDECVRMQNFVSTVLRDKTARVWLIANTLSRVSPYTKEFALDNMLRMKQGDIDVYNYNVNGEPVKLALEYCQKQENTNTMFFGRASKQIVSGEWDVKDVNKLPKDVEFENVYEMLVEYQNFRFVMQLLVECTNGDKIVFVYPYTKGDKIRTERTLTDRFEPNPFISARLDLNKLPERYISECFALNKVCFSDNLTGADFSAVNDHFHIANMF